MENEALTAADYASVHRATELLSTKYLHRLTLNAGLEAWSAFVEDVEGGFDVCWAWEFDNEAVARGWLHDAWPILTERVRLLRQPELDALDDRFRAATAPTKPLDASRSALAEGEKWWYFRYPLRVTGNPEDQLPPTWSPRPMYI